ncbi:MAG: hypothetical protein WBX27_01455 [Specibacter sp.]
MNSHREQDQGKNPTSAKPADDQPGNQEHAPAGGTGVKDPRKLPDGSGSDRRSGDDGKEVGDESFDAG